MNDSIERIKEDAIKPFYQYWNCANADDCMNCCISCNSKIDGKRPSEHYKTGCQYAMNLDLIDRTIEVMKVSVERTCKMIPFVEEDDSVFIVNCSECGNGILARGGKHNCNYCPNCGARVIENTVAY